MAHARASASAAYRWWECPGSIDAASAFPNVESKYATEGTAAHADGAKALTDRVESNDPAVQVYVNYIRQMSTPTTRMIEVDLTPALQKIHPDLGGTADCGIIGLDWIEIVDYKHGAGIYVEAEDNLQLRIYALGLLLTVNRAGIKRVRATIVQPRIEHAKPIRTWEFDAVELLEFAADIATAAERTKTKELKPGEWCKFCPAAATCPALNAQRTEMIAAEFTPGANVALIAKGLGMVPALEAQIKALRELAYNLAVQGVPIPGHKLVEKRATRKWKDPEGLAGVAGPTWFEDPTLKSPAQVEKMLGKKSFGEKCADLVTKESSGYTLVADSDNRPAAQPISLEDFTVDGTAEKSSSPPSPFNLD